MLVTNKVAVTYLPEPSLVLTAQLLFAVLTTVGLNAGGFVEMDELSISKVKRFYLVAVIFLATIFSNMKTLQYANVETFIVCRTSTPLLIAPLDYLCLGRELPSPRSLISLTFTTIGAIGYLLTDKGFQIIAYEWIAVWVVVLTIDMVYIKYVIETVPMTSWGRVYYQNLLALPLVLMIGCLTGAVQDLLHLDLSPNINSFEWTFKSLIALLVSCICGTGLSYFGFRLRKAVSATSFTVIGNLCKIGTVVINLMIWDKHASSTGLLFLLMCLASAAFYQQAPLRVPAPPFADQLADEAVPMIDIKQVGENDKDTHAGYTTKSQAC
jgi:GDP-mannose transporter